MAKFAENGGKARWIISPIISREDWDALRLGIEGKTNMIIRDILFTSLENLERELNKKVLSALSWMIADEIIDLRIAIPRNELTGEFHDKFGIFTDLEGNRIYFVGSYNDSIQGLRNYESITVFKSWDWYSSKIVDDGYLRFEGLWNNKDVNVKIIPLPDAVKEKFIKLRNSSRSYSKSIKRENIMNFTSREISLPSDVLMRPYQIEAVEAWVNNNECGFLEMATGTGKTLTALYASVVYFNKHERIPLVITCPYKHLVDQWEKDTVRFGYKPIKAYESFDSWANRAANEIKAFNKGYRDNICIITTNNTFMTDNFANIANQICLPVFLIADEAHHFGTEKSLKYLDEKFKARLALSATPTRWFDEVGTDALKNYFGETVFSFPLAKAIEEGYLTQYYYYPIIVELTEEEIERYIELSDKIAVMLNKKDKTEREEKHLTALLIRRADILKDAENKFEALETILLDCNDLNHALFYCSPKQRIPLLNLLGHRWGFRIHQFTYQESNALRHDILDQFNKKELNAVVAIKCLDEGVDVPSTRIAFFLANGTNPREFVQRRGRILRKSPGKSFSILYDFLTIPPLDSFNNDQVGRSILKKELTRFKEFADNSINTHSATEIIWEIAKSFDMLDF